MGAALFIRHCGGQMPQPSPLPSGSYIAACSTISAFSFWTGIFTTRTKSSGSTAQEKRNRCSRLKRNHSESTMARSAQCCWIAGGCPGKSAARYGTTTSLTCALSRPGVCASLSISPPCLLGIRHTRTRGRHVPAGSAGRGMTLVLTWAIFKDRRRGRGRHHRRRHVLAMCL